MKGFGRSEDESFGNACKNLLSDLASKDIDIDKITQSIRFKNGMQINRPMSQIMKNN